MGWIEWVGEVCVILFPIRPIKYRRADHAERWMHHPVHSNSYANYGNNVGYS